MPTVPEATNRVGIASVTGEKLQPQDLSGTGLSAVGAGLEQVAQAGDQYAKQLQHTQNLYDDAAVKSAQNTYTYGTRAILHQGDDAFYGKVGFGAGDALQPTQDALTKARDDARGMLKSDRQRELFDHAITNRYTSDLADTSDFAHHQVKFEQNTQSIALQANSAQDALTNYNDPAKRDLAIATGLAAIETQSIGQGKGVDWAKDQKLKYTSGIHTAQINNLATSDPVSASALFNEKRGEMTAADQLSIERGLRDPMLERAGEANADRAVAIANGAASAAGSPPGADTAAAVPSFTADRGKLHAVVSTMESHGQEYTNGKLTTSSVGAQGSMQVMPGTQTDPGYGVRKAADNSPAEIKRVGDDYLDAMVAKYKGDVPRALAAYNAGPGSPSTPKGLYAAEQKAKAAGHPEAWLSYMKPETQQYVAKGVGMLGGTVTAGVAPGTGPTKDNIKSAYAAVDAMNLSFDEKKATMAALDRRMSRDDRIVTQTQNDAYDQALTMSNQIGTKFTSLNQLPPNVRQNLSPEHVASLTKLAESNATPAPIPANGDTMITLHQQAVLDPDKFAKTDLRVYRPNMTPGEYSELTQLQTKQIAKPNDPDVVSHQRIWRQVEFYGRDIGIDMGVQKKDEKPEAFKARRQDGQNLFNVMDNTLSAITDRKRQPTDDEIKKAYDNAIMTKAGPNNEAIPRFRMVGAPTNSVAIPQAVHDDLRNRRRAAGLPYDDQSIARMYIKGVR